MLAGNGVVLVGPVGKSGEPANPLAAFDLNTGKKLWEGIDLADGRLPVTLKGITNGDFNPLGLHGGVLIAADGDGFWGINAKTGTPSGMSS